MKGVTVLGFAAAGAAPVAVAAALVRDDGLVASCDEAVLRTVGHGYTGLFHGLDGIVTAPLGLHAQWASIACVGLLGTLAFALARQLGRSVVLAFAAAFLATVTYPALHEGTLAFGSALGAVLALVPLLSGMPVAARFVGVGLALTYDVPTAIASLVGVAVAGNVDPRRPRRAWLGALTGLLPLAWMVWRRRASPEASLDVTWMAGALGDGPGVGSRTAMLAVLEQQLGLVGLVFALIGLGDGLRRPETRRLSAGLASVIVVAAGATAVGAPSGAPRYSGILLAAVAATSVLTASGMGVLAGTVARARVPFARESAAMIVLLCLALPARVADDTQLAFSRDAARGTAAWNTRVLDGVPQDAVLLLPTPGLVRRVRAARVIGRLPPGVLIVAAFGSVDRATSLDIAKEPLVGPVVRDLLLEGAPEELSLSELAAKRPVLLAFRPGWGRSIAKHLVPEGLFDRYYVEPRGTIERQKLLAAAVLDDPTMSTVCDDPVLADGTRELLRARALGAMALGDSERTYAHGASAELLRMDTLGSRRARR